MSSEQPSLFDQLAPSDSLRDDLAWIDSLQESVPEDDKPVKQERRPRKHRERKTGRADRDSAQDRPAEASTPPPPPSKPEREPEQPMLIVPDMSTDDESNPPADTSAPAAATGSDTLEETSVLDGVPAETTVIESESSILPDTQPAETLEDVADPDAPSNDSKAMTWVKRGLLIAGAAILLLVILALIGSHSTAVKEKTAFERVQTSMSRLAESNSKAKTMIGKADKTNVEDDDVDTLRSLVASNGKLIRSKRAGLSIDESDRLSAKADKATKRTRTLTGKVDRLVKAKPLTDAKKKCRTALDKAVKASTDAKPSDDTTRAAKATLDKLIGQARKLDAKTTVDTWNDTASKLDKARESLSQALEAKAKADEEAKRQAEAQAQAQQQAQQQQRQQSTPAPTPQYRRSSGSSGSGSGSGSPSVPQGNSGGSANSNGGTSNGNSGGWYVPPETTDNSLPNNDSSL